MNKSFIQARVNHFEQVIPIYEQAILELQNPMVEEYLIDTGQTTQRVKRRDLPNLQKLLDSLYNQYSVWFNRLNGGSTTILVPKW